MELGRWGDERHRQVRGLADRSPGVAHGGGDTLYPLLAPTCAAPNEVCRAAPNSVLAEMMELGRWGDERHRQVRGLADRSPGVAHGGGDTLYPLLAPTCAAPNEACCRRRFLFSGNDGARAVGRRATSAGTGSRRSTAGCCARWRGYSLSLARSDLRRAERSAAGGAEFLFSGNDGARAVGRRATSAGTGSRRSIAGCCARWRGYSLSLARSDLRRAERSLPAAPNSVLAEMMELGRWGDERHRQVRGLADRSPGVAHGGGDTLYPLLAPTCAAPNEVCRRRRIPF